MRRILGVGASGLVLVAGLFMSSGSAQADAPSYCQYPLGSKIVTVPCGEDALAEPGMAGNLPMQLPPAMPPAASPGSAPPIGAQRYLSELNGLVHPNVSSDRLVELGSLACSARGAGASSDEASMTVWQNLADSGVISNKAETGTLVHAAVDSMCPGFGYP